MVMNGVIVCVVVIATLTLANAYDITDPPPTPAQVRARLLAPVPSLEEVLERDGITLSTTDTPRFQQWSPPLHSNGGSIMESAYQRRHSKRRHVSSVKRHTPIVKRSTPPLPKMPTLVGSARMAETSKGAKPKESAVTPINSKTKPMKKVPLPKVKMPSAKPKKPKKPKVKKHENKKKHHQKSSKETKQKTSTKKSPPAKKKKQEPKAKKHVKRQTHKQATHSNKASELNLLNVALENARRARQFDDNVTKSLKKMKAKLTGHKANKKSGSSKIKSKGETKKKKAQKPKSVKSKKAPNHSPPKKHHDNSHKKSVVKKQAPTHNKKKKQDPKHKNNKKAEKEPTLEEMSKSAEYKDWFSLDKKLKSNVGSSIKKDAKIKSMMAKAKDRVKSATARAKARIKASAARAKARRLRKPKKTSK